MLALSVAPLGAWAMVALLYVGSYLISKVAGDASNPLDGALLLSMFLASTLLGLVPGLFVSAVLGVTAHALLTLLHRRDWGSYTVAGMLAGVPIWAALASINSEFCGDTSNPCFTDLPLLTQVGQVLFWGVAPATSGALTFWAVMRPDRLAASAPSDGSS